MESKNNVTSDNACVLQEILKVIGGKWSMSIVYILFSGTHRFSQLEKSIPHINTRMLIKELKTLASFDIVSRKVYATVPPTVEYTLTEKGKMLKPIIDDIYEWGKVNL